MKNMYTSVLSRWLMLLLLLSSQTLLAQTAPAPPIQWQKTINIPYTNTAIQSKRPYVVKASGGGYAVATIHNRLLRLSDDGTTRWQVDIPSSQPGLPGLYQVYETAGLLAMPDGGFVVLTADAKFWSLARLDANGNVMWVKPFDDVTPATGGNVTYFYKTSLVQANDGGFIVGGYEGSPRGITAATVYSFSPDGTKEAKKALTFYDPSLFFRSSTAINKIVPAFDGGYIAVGVAASSSSAQPLGWAARIDDNLNIIWQNTYALTGHFDDIIKATDGKNYLITGITDAVIPSYAGIRAIDGMGQLIQDQRSDTRSGDTYDFTGSASIVPIPNSSPTYSALFVTASSNNSGNDFRVAAPNLKISLGGTGNDVAADFLTTDDGGYLLVGTTTSTDGDVQGKVGNTPATWLVKLGPATTLKLTQPTYNCSTGAITFNTTGGNGTLISYTAPGIIRSSSFNNSGTVEQGLRNDPKVITITATQSGQTTSYSFDLKAACTGTTPTPTPTPNPPTTGSTLTLTQPTYNCSTGAITFNTTGGNGSTITYTAPGIMRSSATSNTGTVEQGLRNDPKTILITAMQSGQMATYSFDLKAFCSGTTPTTPTMHPDMQPLVDLYNATNGPSWKNKTNWLTGNSPCNWFGVSCNADGRVIGVSLSYNNLNGTLPSSLGNLSELQRFSIFSEPLVSGSIPASLGNLSKLQLLGIEYTQISGSIPESLGNLKQLEQLYLAKNELSGSIPESLGNLSSLKTLYLFGNQLTGNLPNSFASLPQIQSLHLYFNRLSGCIPSGYTALCGKDVQLSSNAGLPGGGDFAAFCANPSQNCGPNKLLTLTQPTYNCSTGAITFNLVNSNGSPITYTAPGITRSSVTSNSGIVEQGLRNDPKTITITATQSGYSTSYSFDLKAFCSGTTPAPTPTPSGGTLTLTQPTYDCSTGAFTFNFTGGNGSPVEFQAAGITGWTTNRNQFVDKDSRTASDVKPFTLMARQNGQVVTYTWDLKAACGRSARLAATEAGQALELTVKGNPVGNTAIVEIRGAEGQAVQLDLLNANGHVLDQRQIEQAGVVEEQRFELQRQPTGPLFLRAQSGQQKQTVKLIKQ